MTTIKLIRRRSGFANINDSFLTIEPGYENIDEFNEELAEYTLPEGYTVARTNLGETGIFDPTEKYCEIIMHRPTGRPQLVGGPGKMPVLARATADAEQ